MQHDIFLNPGRLNRGNYPFIAVLQSDIVESEARLVCPLARPFGAAASRTMPEIVFQETRLLLVIELVSSVPRRALRQPIGSIEAYRSEIVAALDWLFTGI